ncbi:MAG: histidine phosphatase family protein [Pseudomonadales bacterium]|nr:histidine phosphatase family protein [Pseudomonadales bacterium]
MSRDKLLHPKLEPSLKMLPAGCHIHLLTRHSIREKAASKRVSYKLPLTKEGVLLAEQWGELLTWPVESFYSSAVGRCVDTAKAMARGQLTEGSLVDAKSINTEDILMEPGSYVSDMALAGPIFNRIGPLRFASQHLSEEITAGVVSPQAGAKRFFEYFQAKTGSVNTLSVHVTHDTILAALVYHLLEVSEISEDHWPWMMEGLFIWFDQGFVNWVWRGGHHRRALS